MYLIITIHILHNDSFLDAPTVLFIVAVGGIKTLIYICNNGISTMHML